MSNNVKTLFSARRQQYEKAINDFNLWFESPHRGYDADSIEWDLRLLAAIEEKCKAMLETPAMSLDDVAFKADVSRSEVDDILDEPGMVEQLSAAIKALQQRDTVTAAHHLESALEGVLCPAQSGAAAALDDLHRMENNHD